MEEEILVEDDISTSKPTERTGSGAEGTRSGSSSHRQLLIIVEGDGDDFVMGVGSV